jgi:lipoate-protein ligase A
VKRPTGGRGVFHQHELTYALVTGERHGFTGPVLVDYQRIGLGLKQGFNLLGLEVELAEGNHWTKRPLSSVCFANSSWYEITYQGRKLVGSAQLRRGKALLQHGSILLAFDPWFWREVWAEDSTTTSVENGAFQQELIGLAEALNPPPERAVIISALQQGLSAVLGVTWQEEVLTPEELELAIHLQKEKYTNPDWNNHRGRKDGVFAGASGTIKEEANR